MNDIVEGFEDGRLSPQLLDIVQIRTDNDYQRSLNKILVKRIAKNLNMFAFGCPIVARRMDGQYYVVDGQTRLASMRLVGTKNVWCMVFESKGQAQEAAIFLILNRDRHAVSQIARFEAGIVAKDPETLEIAAILDQYEIHITQKSTWVGKCQISCPGTLYKINRWGVLADTLAVLWKAFAKADVVRRSQVLQTGIIGGIGYIFRNEPNIDKDRLVKCLEAVNINSWHKEVTGSNGAREPRYAKYLIKNFYNKRLRNRIECDDWVKE